MDRRNLFVGAAAAALAPFAFVSSAKAQTLRQDGAKWFTNAEVKTHDGRSFRFYDDLLVGKIVMINFFFIDCDAICPLTTQNLTNVQDLLGSRIGKDIFMYSISLQPERDTPERLANYAKTYGIGPGWLLLTGKPAEIEVLRRRLGFVDPDPVLDADLEQHLGTVRIGNEPLHRWSMSPALLNPAAIVRAVKRAIPERV